MDSKKRWAGRGGCVEQKDESFREGVGNYNNLSLSDFARERVTTKPRFESKSFFLDKHCDVPCSV